MHDMTFEAGLVGSPCRDLIAIFFAIAISRIAWLAVKYNYNSHEGLRCAL